MSANATQVGGTHYNNAGYPHWDLAAHLRMGYFEGQITKYITRHKTKKGLEDVQKARHFTLKLIELVRNGQQPMHSYPTSQMMADYVHHNDLGPLERAVIMDVLTWHFPADLHRALVSIDSLLHDTYAITYGATDGSAPTSGYTNQDR